MTIKVNIIEKLPGEKTIRMEDFLKVLHPEGKRVWRKIKLVREKLGMEKAPAGAKDKRPWTSIDQSEEDYLAESFAAFSEMSEGSWWRDGRPGHPEHR